MCPRADTCPQIVRFRKRGIHRETVAVRESWGSAGGAEVVARPLL
jgi:hypothetical protein